MASFSRSFSLLKPFPLRRLFSTRKMSISETRRQSKRLKSAAPSGSFVCNSSSSDDPFSKTLKNCESAMLPIEIPVENSAISVAAVSSASGDVTVDSAVPSTEKLKSTVVAEADEGEGEDSGKEGGNIGSLISSAENSATLTLEQRQRMEINKLFALAKKNLRMCEERISNARAEGLSFVTLEELLVEKTWVEAIGGEFVKPYMKTLSEFVEAEMKGSVPIYPPPFLIFKALNSTPVDKVKVVIIGQDPYHGPGQAMGLCFSVPQGVKVPSSLVNIFKELEKDMGCSIPSHGNLERWAIQGVLLLNAVLTVRQSKPNSHAKKGWETLTDAVIKTISQKRKGVVFLMWGNYAQEKSRLVDSNKHHVLKAAHPSGLSASRGFFGCRHFSQANKILEEAGLLPIDWQL